MVLLGILLSSYNKEIISWNTTGVEIGFERKTKEETQKENRENIILPLNVPVAMGEYFAIYRGDSSSATDPRRFFKVDYERRDTTTNEVTERFTLYPDLIKPKNSESFTANPASKHYLTRDIFTYINGVSNEEQKDTYKKHVLHKGDSVFLTGGYMIFNGFNTNVPADKFTTQPGDIAVAADISIYDLKGKVQDVAPIYYIRGKVQGGVDDTLKSMMLYTRFTAILPEQNAAEIEVMQANPEKNYVVLKAMVFPYINVLWLGVIVMVIGFFISFANRYKAKA
jgi:cytochrome c-type biogenesis protein CcmF